ncbi:C39 family peptidase [Bacillus aquiflavi]|uniref:C39 family peptidase n=1 Tax=Bacillus aquiflavi TaxID=2672567 RepID=A0A6B3VWC4_9BACI|nr:C39 family peptidase [Bacillus aquiflavi]MBA4538070.1 C39 family peptidase [Bacillus aquiflavi]NEY82369.1 C39 family peptidase [Bacillus aquiflavi]UAC49228.1 C39 family peptidase [Bacillus aquiflavi]
MKKILSVLIALPLLGCAGTKETKSFRMENETPLPAAYKSGDNRQNQSAVQKIEQQKTTEQDQKKEKIILDVPLIKQNPELKYGCEVTSTAMVLQYSGVNTNKMELYEKVKKDPDPIKRAPSGDILEWGNPAEGYVGDMTGKTAGYAVFDKPIVDLINQYLPNKAVNLTNKDFEEVLAHVSKGYPVVIWTTGDYRLPDRWEAWKHGNETIETPLDLHVVVLVGYDQNYVYLNDPLSGKKQAKVNKEQFISSWKALKQRAVSYK